MTMTDQEYKRAWQDEPDAQELSEMAKEVRNSYAHKYDTPSPDVNEEWKTFQSKHLLKPLQTLKPSNSQTFIRWAIAASMILLCTICVAWGWTYLKEWKIKNQKPQTIQTPQTSQTLQSSEDSTYLVFENAELKTILQEIAVLHETRVDYRCKEEVFLYVKLDKSWSLKQSIDFLNHFERVNLTLTPDNTIVAQ